MPARKKWRIAGINFDFRHMDHLLELAHAAPNAEIVGIAHHDPREMQHVVTQCQLPEDRVFADWRACLEKTRPDVVILCPTTGVHAEWVEQVAPYRVHLLLEKPFAASLPQADRMIVAMRKARRELAINWPLAWYPPHLTAHRLLREGRIGDLEEVHFYNGNRGPIQGNPVLGAPEPLLAKKKRSWFYFANGGGSLIDYLGYGATLGTWYFDGRKPEEITTVTAAARGVPVDEQSVTVARYGDWLSTFHTRWGTFTCPWIVQPQPKCGFILKGTAGSLSNYDYEPTVRLQDAKHPQGLVIPIDRLRKPRENPVQYFLHCLETGQPVEGPLSVKIARIGQQIVDTAALSAKTRKPQKLLK
ncbi:MAG: Gfo/Idh/MocA family protein [Opitutales bacterium]